MPLLSVGMGRSPLWRTFNTQASRSTEATCSLLTRYLLRIYNRRSDIADDSECSVAGNNYVTVGLRTLLTS
jgi:hypothetical protein